VRHPGAGRFACSSAVEIDILFPGKILDLLLQVVGLDANRALDPLGAGIVVPVAANIDDQKVALSLGSQPLRQFLYLHARDNAINAVPAILRDTVDRVTYQR